MRPYPIVIAACAAAALSGGFVFGAEVVLTAFAEGDIKILISSHALEEFFSAVRFGFFLCVAAELIIIFPAIALTNKLSWWWNNLVNSGIMGFLIGFISTFSVFMMPIEGKLSEKLGNFSNGHLTQQGLELALSNAVSLGFVGAVCGLVFQVIAVRRSGSRAGARSALQ